MQRYSDTAVQQCNFEFFNNYEACVIIKYNTMRHSDIILFNFFNI